MKKKRKQEKQSTKQFLFRYTMIHIDIIFIHKMFYLFRRFADKEIVLSVLFHICTKMDRHSEHSETRDENETKTDSIASMFVCVCVFGSRQIQTQRQQGDFSWHCMTKQLAMSNDTNKICEIHDTSIIIIQLTRWREKNNRLIEFCAQNEHTCVEHAFDTLQNK